MISKEQIQRVHALVEKWGITDPIKQHCKMGEEIGEYLEARRSRPEWIREEEMKKEMGDMWFTLIALCKQLDIDFKFEYKRMRNHVLNRISSNTFTYVATVSHLELGGDLLKNKPAFYQIGAIMRNWLEECRTQEFDESVCLGVVLIKNENKAGETVNGTFIKEQDLK